MTQETHTEGAWTIGWGRGLSGPTTPTQRPFCGGDAWDYMPVSCNGETIAVCPRQAAGYPGDYKANAALIAAAPDLLEALKYARRMVRASECDIGFIDAAIARATQST